MLFRCLQRVIGQPKEKDCALPVNTKTVKGRIERARPKRVHCLTANQACRSTQYVDSDNERYLKHRRVQLLAGCESGLQLRHDF